jgi:UPF0755 protein
MQFQSVKALAKKHRILWSLLLLIVATVFVGGVLVVSDMAGGGNDEGFVVEIPEGAGSQSIAEVLEKYTIIRYPMAFRMYVRIQGTPVWQKGKHTLSTAMSYGAIVKKLQSPPDVQPDIRKVVIPEGYELRQMIDLLVENGLGERESFMTEVETGIFDYTFIKQIPVRENRLEGYLYPDTYLFSVEETEHQILDKMLAAFEQKVMPVYDGANTETGLDKILTLASVIEREAANDEERPKVASVFYNRLNIGMKLESCATVQYLLKERKDVLSLADIAVDSPYNTYKYTGLPIGPIASPGIASIKAALYPADTNYLYFVATADGEENLFSETFQEHNQKTIQTQGD